VVFDFMGDDDCRGSGIVAWVAYCNSVVKSDEVDRKSNTSIGGHLEAEMPENERQ